MKEELRNISEFESNQSISEKWLKLYNDLVDSLEDKDVNDDKSKELVCSK